MKANQPTQHDPALLQMLADYAEANAEGKQDMFEETAERMITAETDNAAMRDALQEIAQASEHLEDERFEETHGRVALVMRRLARQTLAAQASQDAQP